MRRKFQRAKPKIQVFINANERIRVPEVFVIDENGEALGSMSTFAALQKAREAELDLVEVNPKANPPIVKIMDLGQFKYEQEKKIHKQKVQQKKVDTKGIRLSVRISEHDSQVRLEQGKKFLAKGDKLRVELVLKGREKQHPEIAAETILQFVKELEKTEGLSLIREQDLTKQGGRFTILLVNKSN
ncbi:MAG: translation initiation factor IF-3 [Patescibacteria group bacterium]|nr:translation initiation factor IF-3 [Patescibacteria group bacterium]MDD4610671.1 translation initiation factor IF-3 [Patescibacteria group bacterium]